MNGWCGDVRFCRRGAERRRGQRFAVVEPEPEWLAAKGRKEGRKKGGVARDGVLFLGKRMVGREMGRTALAPQRLERRRDGF